MTPDTLAHAACRGKPTEWFYPLAVGNTRAYRMSVERWRQAGAKALAVCAHCPVLVACRQETVDDYEWHGIRGGLTPPEVRDLAGPQRKFLRAPHGSHSRYSSGCRCPACTLAHTAYARQRRAS